MTTSSLAVAAQTAPRSSLLSWLRITPPRAALLAIIALAVALNFANLDAIGDANTYYTAAVEAMLQSPSNFFFIAAEPGGSVTIDKPPLGLWLQALSALVFGVNGVAVVLPQLVAGVLSVPLMYALVKRWFGTGAGLTAALVMAIMPVSVAVQRNNTMDATLIFTLLLAAWAFIRATESGKLRWLLAGAVLVGLGFNIKMLQAFLPLPAFYGLYFLGAKIGWRKKIAHLIVTTVLLLAVSFSWIIAVDLTPADSRPYVGSSETNSALELAIGYNGLQRLLGGMGGGADGAAAGDDGSGFTPPAGMTPPQGMTPPAGFTPPPGMTPPAGLAQGGAMFGMEVGQAGALRLFSQPLDNEIGWLLPFGLFSLGLIVVAARPRLPVTRTHQAALLWGGWLLTEIVFFSAASFFHAYYLAMLTPPLAALIGIGVARLWDVYPRRKLWVGLLLALTVGATLLYQASIAAGYTSALAWLVVPVAALAVGAVLLLGGRFIKPLSRFTLAGFAAMVIALTAAPAVWAGLATLETTSNTMLPAAYSGSALSVQLGGPGGMMGGAVDETLLAYLEANTTGMRWMMAVPSSMQGAQYVLESERGVLYMGGFNGQDPVVDAESLAAHVEAGDLRYVLISSSMFGPGSQATDSAIQTWLDSSCAVVSEIEVNSGTLYDCAQ